MSDLKIFAKEVEESALQQIDLLLQQEAFKNCKIRIMPDVHAGSGCVIGFTGNLGDKVIPNIVGVDIGCGMMCVELGNIDIDLGKLDRIIRRKIPSGFEVHKERIARIEDLKDLKCYRELKDTRRLERSLGTLGGGNHFIELDVDEDGNKYLIIHSGSRNLGKQVAEYYQNLANEIVNYGKQEYFEKKTALIKEYKEQGRKQEIQEALKKLHSEYKENKNKIPKDLAYLEGKYKEDYLHDMQICQKFASVNRSYIAYIVCKEMDILAEGFFETIHNYISFEDNIVRKGSISAKKGEKILIPMNMRDGCIIAVGKGNEDWNCSAPHGAGRIMSRMKARETLDLETYKKSMENVYTTSVNKETIDEAPMVYKPMEEILECIGDTCEVLKIIKPIYNFKAS